MMVTLLALVLTFGSLRDVAVTVVKSISPTVALPGAVTVTLIVADAPGPSVILARLRLTDQPLSELAERLILSATVALFLSVCA